MPPRKITPVCGKIKYRLHSAINGIWEWYQAGGKAAQELKDLPFDEEGVRKFIDPLYHSVWDYWPLHCPLEMLFEGEQSLRELDGIHLMLPHLTYDDEYAGVLEAFLSGAHGIGWLMAHYHKSGSLALSPKDEKLIKKVGFEKLAEVYVADPRGKSVDLLKLENLEEGVFADVAARFPERWSNGGNGIPIISADYGDDCSVWITCKEDIDFCLAYAECWAAMKGAMPDLEEFEQNTDGLADKFAHELCTIWRRNKGNEARMEYPDKGKLINVLAGGQK